MLTFFVASVLEPKVRLHFRGAVVKALYKCVLVMLANYNVFDGDLTHHFCMLMLKKCLDSSVKDQFLKVCDILVFFVCLLYRSAVRCLWLCSLDCVLNIYVPLEQMARKICSCYDWKQGRSLVLDILRCSLDLILCECKVVPSHLLSHFSNHLFNFDSFCS